MSERSDCDHCFERYFMFVDRKESRIKTCLVVILAKNPNSRNDYPTMYRRVSWTRIDANRYDLLHTPMRLMLS